MANPPTARSDVRAPEIFADIEQGSTEWFEVRKGIATASNFKMVMATSTTEQKTRTTYLYKLAGEIITGELSESYKNDDMARGNEWEDEARELYDFARDKNDGELTRIGFAKNHAAGCSPDALIGSNGVLEIKTSAPHVQIGLLLKEADWFPPEHKWQCLGNLWVLNREWLDLRIYSRKMPMFQRRMYRDEAALRELRGGVNKFNDDLANLVQTIKSM